MGRCGNRTRLLGSGASARVAQWMQRSLIKSIQRGTITMTGVASNTATITAVVMANSVLRFLGSTFDTSSAEQNKARARVSFTNSTTITATVNTAPTPATITVGFEVTEYWPGVIKSVQRGTIQGATTATITAVNTAKSDLHFLGFTTAITSGDVLYSVRIDLTNSTTVTQAEGGAQTNVGGYQVVEWF